MPDRMPEKPRAKTKTLHDGTEQYQHRVRVTERQKQHALETIDWLAIWALSLGFCAVVMAGFALFGARDATGAAMILVGTAAIIALVLFASKAPGAPE